MNKRIFLMLRLMFIRSSTKRADYLRKKHLFKFYGERGSWHSFSRLPSEPELISIGNNVHIAANVRFITHDIICDMFNRAGYNGHWKYYTDEIKVQDNVMIGADSIVMYGVTIGSNVIIAAGSVITKNIPDGEIWGGNPAKRIGLTAELAERRKDK